MMQRIDANTVDLTPEEMKASEFFEESLDMGFNIAQAVTLTRKGHPGLTEEFYEYLGQ